MIPEKQMAEIRWRQLYAKKEHAIGDRSYLLEEVDRLRSKRVSIEDTGPILEAICIASWSADIWTQFDAGRKAKIKNDLLLVILPGLNIFIDQINTQLAS